MVRKRLRGINAYVTNARLVDCSSRIWSRCPRVLRLVTKSVEMPPVSLHREVIKLQAYGSPGTKLSVSRIIRRRTKVSRTQINFENTLVYVEKVYERVRSNDASRPLLLYAHVRKLRINYATRRMFESKLMALLSSKCSEMNRFDDILFNGEHIHVKRMYDI